MSAQETTLVGLHVYWWSHVPIGGVNLSGLPVYGRVVRNGEVMGVHPCGHVLVRQSRVFDPNCPIDEDGVQTAIAIGEWRLKP